MNREQRVSVLFVCMGNICRSPTAEGVFRHHATDAGVVDRLVIDSAGTHAYHVGEPPDRRSQAAAERRGISLAGIAARKVADDDFEHFDLILAMDEDNYRLLIQQSEPVHHNKIRLFLDYGGTPEREVPDPYYGGASGFERVLDLVEDASKGLLNAIRR
ncbi:MAG: low molecular weight protein-tyrosine-phosphatase [Pseudomonadota bacterium]